MRRIILSLIVASTCALAFHVFPLGTDSFAIVEKGNQYFKVFHCGWPLNYAVSDQVGDGAGILILKFVFNFVAVFFLAMVAFATHHALFPRLQSPFDAFPRFARKLLRHRVG
jgi:hypothetical protein